MLLTLVVAASENNVIGRDNRLPWTLPDDLRHFKDVTLGKPVIMGRKTYESIGHALPGRKNIVITRQKDYVLGDSVVVHSLEDALRIAREDNPAEVCVIGGADMFRQAMPMADVIHFTRVHAGIDGDAFFPVIDPRQWEEMSVEEHGKDERHEYGFSFVEYVRR